MSGADDYEHALGGLRGHIVYGEQTAGDTPVAWVQVKVALPYLRDAERALVAERTRADAAEAELARLTTERDAARAEAAGLRAIVEGRTVPTPDDAAAHALAHPLPTPGAASNGATCDEPIGLWLCVVDGEGAAVLRLAHESDDQGPYLMAWSSDYGWCGTGDIRRAWPLDASGRPCPWPTVAAEAATGAALAGEGR